MDRRNKDILNCVISRIIQDVESLSRLIIRLHLVDCGLADAAPSGDPLTRALAFRLRRPSPSIHLLNMRWNMMRGRSEAIGLDFFFLFYSGT